MKSSVLFLLASCGLPLAAHHSFAAEFDDKQPVKLEGTVVKFEFMNPHSWIRLDVKDANGAVVRWSVETGSTNALFRRGWRKDSLRPGDPVQIEAFRANGLGCFRDCPLERNVDDDAPSVLAHDEPP